MAKGRNELLRSIPGAGAALPATSHSGANEFASVASESFGNPTLTFNFWGRVQGLEYPSLSPEQQDEFRESFADDLARLKRWCIEAEWLPSHPPDELKIFVSDEYKISKSLMPASVGQRGRMEFPAWKVIAGEAAIAHELVHVYFPNGNRLLAEGLAIHLQAEIGGNPAFPNFGRPLHDVARELLVKMVPEFAAGDPKALDKIRLTDLDKIATPSPLRLRAGLNLYNDDAVGQAHIYPVVGSFVQFLIATYGLKTFRAVFEQTPLKPFARNPGSSDRWADAYGASLLDLEQKWKLKMSGRPVPA